MRPSFAVSAVVVALLTAGSPALAGGTRTVRVSDYKFTKKVLRIDRGTTVTWRWTGEDPHNVTGRGFRSATKTSGTFRHRFTRPGTYRYACTLHARSFGMRGTIIVR